MLSIVRNAGRSWGNDIFTVKMELYRIEKQLPMKPLILLLTIVFSTAIVNAQNTEKRFSLVLGNATYEHGNKINSANEDAKLMAKTTAKIGFSGIFKENASKQVMGWVANDFKTMLKTHDMGLFYFAGYAGQIDGKNYLIPVDAQTDNNKQIKDDAFNLETFVKTVSGRPNSINIFIINAYTNIEVNDVAWKSGIKLSADSFPNSIIIIANQSGGEVGEQHVKNNLFTKELTKQMLKPQPIDSVFLRTKREVIAKSKGKINLQVWSTLNMPFYLTDTEIDPE